MMKTLIKIKLLGLVRSSLQNKKTKQSKSRTILMAILFIYVGVVIIGMFYGLFSSIIEPFHMMNLDWLYFAIMAVLIFILSFVGSVFVCEHELYEAKDNELLLSMPLTNRTILLSRLCIILLLDYLFELMIIIPALFVYFQFYTFTIGQMLMFVIVALSFPFLVLTVTMLLSWVVAIVMRKVRYKNIITLVLWIIFFGLYMYGIQYIQNYIIFLVQNGQSIAQAIEKSLFPIYHLAQAIVHVNLLSLIIYLLCTLIPFVIALYVLSVNFIKLSLSKGKQKKRIYKEKPMKIKSVLFAIYVRELRHFFSNAMVILNGITGELMLMISCIGLVIYKNDIQMFISQLSMNDEFVLAIVILMSISLNAMNIISASLISLEGNSLWILKSLPLTIRDIVHSKLLLHLTICLPGQYVFSIVATVIFHFSIKEILLVIIIPSLMIVFTAIFGLLMNFIRPRFDWINETVCVKQSMSVFMTMLVSMSLPIIIGFGYLKLFSDFIGIQAYIYIVLILFVLLDFTIYLILMKFSMRKWKLL